MLAQVLGLDLTSIKAASRYFCTLRTILMATYSLFFLSQHSSTRPKVPAQYQQCSGSARLTVHPAAW